VALALAAPDDERLAPVLGGSQQAVTG
jgi:hypothetical protein